MKKQVDIDSVEKYDNNIQNMVSVIIPVYNGEKTIKETIDSVLNQSFTSIEVIVIDDGSTDRTLDIIKNISDTRLKVFSYTNAGLSASRNRGLLYALGEFVSFIDADDLWTSDKIELQLKSLQENSQADVAYSWTNYIDDRGKFLKSGRYAQETGDVYRKMLVYNLFENGSNPLIRKECFTTVGNFDESLNACEDWDMWLRLASRYEFVVVPKVQILYRVSMNSMSANLKRQEVACLKVLERAFSHPKAISLQHLKKSSLALIYKYLAFKALETSSPKSTGRIALEFLWKSVQYNPSILKQSRLILIAMIKIIYIEMRYYLNDALTPYPLSHRARGK